MHLKPLTTATSRPGTDPALIWAQATGFIDFCRPGEVLGSLPVLYEMDSELPRFRCESLSLEGLARKMANPGVKRLELQIPVIPQRARPLHRRKPLAIDAAARPERSTSNSTLLLGVIDSICAFAHRTVRSADGQGTRILNIWDQEARQPSFTTVGGMVPADFGYGCEIGQPALDRLMQSCFVPGLNIVDESACYARAGDERLRAGFIHGAAVLGLLAGQSPFAARDQDAAGRADIAFVQLPRDTVQDSSSASLGRHVLDGLRYIVSCAGPDTRHIIINLSDGSSRGSHDGQSMIEQAMEQLVAQCLADRGIELQIVIAAGNSYDEERHAQLDALSSQPQTLTLRLPPGNETPSFVSLRLSSAAAAHTEIRLLPPGVTVPDEAGWLAVGAAEGWCLETSESPVCGAILMPAVAAGYAALGLLAFAPTQVSQPSRAPCPAGTWRLQLRLNPQSSPPTVTPGKGEAALHCWISKNQQNASALARSKQPYFIDVDAGYDPRRHLRRADKDAAPAQSAIRRQGTLNSFATGPAGRGVVVVGGMLGREQWKAEYSSDGPSAAPAGRATTDWVAVTDQSAALAGIRLHGSLSGICLRGVGTSFAAPQVARMLANAEPPQPVALLRGRCKVR